MTETARFAGVAGAVLLLLPNPAAAGPDKPVVYGLAGLELLGDGPTALQLGAGASNFFRDAIVEEDDDLAAEARAELRFGEKTYGIGPMVGVMGNSEGGVFGYGGVYADVAWGSWIVSPSAALGGYRRGGGKPLGGTFQFHVALDVAYMFENGARLGVKLAHISNAGIHEINPGIESALLTYSIPLTGRSSVNR